MRIIGFIVTVLAASALATSVAAARDVTKDELLTTALVYNFLRFSEVDRTRIEGDGLTLCVDEAADVAAAMTTLSGKPVHDLTVDVELSIAYDFAGCDVVYLADAKALAAVPAHALTISPAKGFVGKGGAVGIVTVGGRVRFEVDLPAIGDTAFSPSSRLLRLAHRVVR